MWFSAVSHPSSTPGVWPAPTLPSPLRPVSWKWSSYLQLALRHFCLFLKTPILISRGWRTAWVECLLLPCLSKSIVNSHHLGLVYFTYFFLVINKSVTWIIFFLNNKDGWTINLLVLAKQSYSWINMEERSCINKWGKVKHKNEYFKILFYYMYLNNVHVFAIP